MWWRRAVRNCPYKSSVTYTIGQLDLDLRPRAGIARLLAGPTQPSLPYMAVDNTPRESEQLVGHVRKYPLCDLEPPTIDRINS